ncbi:hypothetical protein SMSP2_01569 [Limihaloglobus sulfuriphilus]|uniref:Uncharacterized protein n=1 Tax=Limihaloglobus sulfuriphilus TaxID=1851148 RepID=A0A1Q2MES2_9BACT|nr:hypothetical protein [Limihaloglobus sulfuriphilus]AQQ71203.1 hypothetical protein SMSP2_01569 [Limihaloglobus sulfuriphilus]
MLANVIFPFFIILPNSLMWPVVVALCLLIETWVCKSFFKLKMGKAFFLVFTINLLSTVAGGAATFFVGSAATAILPNPEDLIQYVNLVFPTALICYAILLFATVTIEFIAAKAMILFRKEGINTKVIFKTILTANLLSYCIAVPMHYYHARPPKPLRNIVDDTAWSQKPAKIVYYLSTDGKLMSILTDGMNRKVVFNDKIENYLLCEDLKCFISWTDGYELHHHNIETGEKKLAWRSKHDKGATFAPIRNIAAGKFSSAQSVAISPGGERAAVCMPLKGGYNLTKDKNEPDYYTLFIYDTLTGKTIEKDIRGFGITIAWGSKNNILYLKNAASDQNSWKYTRVRIGGNDILACESVINIEPEMLCMSYGRIGSDSYLSRNTEFKSDSYNSYNVSAVSGWGAFAVTNSEDPSYHIRINDSHFLVPYYWCSFTECGFLPGSSELICEARGGLYIIDYKNMKMGKLCEGMDFVITSDLCNKGTCFLKE